MNNNYIYCILQDSGFEEIESKNLLMRSFHNPYYRINVYNTGTVTIQHKNRINKPITIKSGDKSQIEKDLIEALKNL